MGVHGELDEERYFVECPPANPEWLEAVTELCQRLGRSLLGVRMDEETGEVDWQNNGLHRVLPGRRVLWCTHVAVDFAVDFLANAPVEDSWSVVDNWSRRHAVLKLSLIHI